MNAKQKAIELVAKFEKDFDFYHDNDGNTDFVTGKLDFQNRKQCALICVNEMIALVDTLDGNKKITNFYNNVKTEIEKL